MAFEKTKVDPELGRKIENHLRSLGIHTPTTSKLEETEKEKISSIEPLVYSIMETLGLDLTDDSLCDTPRRVAKMFVLEKFWGLKPENFPKCTTIENKMHYDEMIVEKNIRVMSDCEHHLVQIDGLATVAYIPKERVLGLSKMNRIVEYFSRRPQVQERLTQQIAEALKFILGTEDVAVVIKAKHYCVISRGVEDQNSETVTSYISGAFKTNSSVRSEFMAIAENFRC
jgi:GTP cyclohydrolase I